MRYRHKSGVDIKYIDKYDIAQQVYRNNNSKKKIPIRVRSKGIEHGKL